VDCSRLIVVTKRDAAAVGLPIALRDFAVASALATQVFGPPAATVAGIYGVLMLITGAIAATTLRRRHPA
jgi:predicted Na+-dependent transporter